MLQRARTLALLLLPMASDSSLPLWC